MLVSPLLTFVRSHTLSVREYPQGDIPVVLSVKDSFTTPGSLMAPPSMIEVPEAGTGRTPLAGPGGRIVKEKVPKSDAVAVKTPVIVSPGASLPLREASTLPRDRCRTVGDFNESSVWVAAAIVAGDAWGDQRDRSYRTGYPAAIQLDSRPG